MQAKEPPPTYTTLSGEVLDLSRLTSAEHEYLARCYAAYRAGMAWEQFTHLSVGTEHPLLRATAGYVTPAVWNHPLYRAVRDLEYRLGIQQEEIDPNPGDDPSRDPFTRHTPSAALTVGA